MAKKAKVSKSAKIPAHTEALRENTRVLKQHTKMLRAAIASHATLTDALESHAAVVSGKPSLVEIKARVERATGNAPGSLRDTDKVINMIAGGGPVRDTLMSRINNEFWPGAAVPHLTFDQIKGMDIATLVKTIQRKL